jgi:ABC-2 type transport system permease protein
MIKVIAGATARSLLARRRAVLMLLLTGLPVLFGVIAYLRGPVGDPVDQTAGTLDLVVVGMLLPLLALVFGTAALGAELEDGSAIHLLTKPVARWRIVTAKIVAAAPLAAGLTGAATLLTGLLVGGQHGAAGVALAYTVAVVVGAVLYVTVFVALSILTTRALIIGLAYIVIWEGMLAGLFEGTRALSIRQYVGSIAAAIDPAASVPGSAALAPATAVAGTVIVLVVAFLVAVRALERYQLSAGD